MELTAVAKWVIIAFGLFIIYVGFLMLFAPTRALAILRKAGSTNFINYTEITLRLVPAIAIVIYADFSTYPIIFKYFGYFMIATSGVLYLIPRKLHHRFALWSASLMTPLMVRFISPFSFFLGGFFLYAVI